MKVGLVLGKFYPPHNGHHFLINEAQRRMEERGGYLIVLIAAAHHESMSLMARRNILEKCHPEAWIVSTYDDHPIDYNDPKIWDLHEAVWRKTLGNSVPMWRKALDAPIVDYVFSSEEYGEELARRLGAQHEMIDLSRETVPISGTAVREDPVRWWGELAGPTRAELVERVVVIGPESSGTTTLARLLARRFDTPWVPEWGRLFAEGVGHHFWTTEDFELIARNQVALEEEMAQRSRNGVLICDTDGFATMMFHELYIGRERPGLAHLFQPADLYLLTSHKGIDFDQDGTRLFEHKRDWMLAWLIRNLPPHKTILISGEDREQQAIQQVESLRHWEFAPPLG